MQRLIKILTALPLTRITVFFILIAIITGSCVQIIDRKSFHNYVINQAKKEVDYLVNNPTDYVVDSNRINKENICADSVCVVTNLINNNSNSTSNVNLHEDSVLDIISKSDGLLSSNGLTYCVTLIVGLLASLLLFRIEKMDKLVAQNKRLVNRNTRLKKEITKLYINANDNFQKLFKSYHKVANILTRIESVFNMSVIVGNVTTSLKQTKSDKEKNDVSTNIAYLCFQLSNLSGEIATCLNSPETKLDYLTKNEKIIITRYLEATLYELKRNLDFVNDEGVKVPELSSILENIKHCVEDIKDTIDLIEVKDN